MKSLYGFTKPYNFNRAAPFIIAIVFLFLIIAIIVAMAVFGKLHWGTYRFIYFFYPGLIALVAAVLSFRPSYAWPLIALFFIEFSLGIGTSILKNAHILRHSMLPLDERLRIPQYQFHPLLQATLTPNFLRLVPALHHDSYGLRGTERDKTVLTKQLVIAAVGGSSTYDLEVPDGQTWPEILERKLGHEFAVLNHGVPGYTTVENLIQTLFYLDAYDVRPTCAIYYEGWNDIRNAHLPNIDPAYANFHLLTQITNLEIRKTPWVAEISPLSKIIIRYFQAWTETIPPPENYFGRDPGLGGDIRLEKIFRTNLEAIAAINKERGITSIFVGQVLNRAKLQNTTSYEWMPLIRQVDVWPLQAHFNKILEETAKELESPAFVPPIDEFHGADFVDQGHFSPEGAEKFAAKLAPFVRTNCKKNHP
jgi:lysophospholipase L1-like esterase